jgi:hypothetical protein
MQGIHKAESDLSRLASVGVSVRVSTKERPLFLLQGWLRPES